MTPPKPFVLSDWPTLRTAFLLVGANCFMTIAWYGHLKAKNWPLWTAIFVSWLIALPEYSLQVPANRLGYGSLSAYQLKILQECITLIVFILFAWLGLGEKPDPKYLVSFSLILAAAWVAFR